MSRGGCEGLPDSAQPDAREVKELSTLEGGAGDEAVADGVPHLDAGQADNPGSNGVLASTNPNIGGYVRGLKTSVDDELSAGGMNHSGKGRRENETHVCFHIRVASLLVIGGKRRLLAFVRCRERRKFTIPKTTLHALRF